MDTKLQSDERCGFSDRLKQILAIRHIEISASKFVAEFNLRADGLAITVHGARKWLVGEAIPTQARLQILANWLGVSASWLRFGEADNSATGASGNEPSSVMTAAEQGFARDIRMLTDANRKLIGQIVKNMLSIQSESTAGRSPLRTRGLTST
jgi:hypothetical protein